MRVTDLWTKNARPTLSFEFFPPRSEKNEASFAKVVDTLAELKPDFVSVTFVILSPAARGGRGEWSRSVPGTAGQ
jgi:5,10-methylenetetrahydrofolate reductase